MTVDQAKAFLDSRGVSYTAMSDTQIMSLASGLSGAGPAGPSSLAGLPFTIGDSFVTASMSKYADILRQSNMTSLSTGAGANAYVFMGKESYKETPEGLVPGKSIWEQQIGMPKHTDGDFQTLSGLMQEFESKSIEDKQHMGKLLFMAGYLGGSGSSPKDAFKSSTLLEISSAYGELLNDAAGRFAAGQNITPDRLLEMNIKFNLSQAGVDTEGQGLKNADSWWHQLNQSFGDDPNDPNSPNFTGDKTQTSRHVDIYSPEDTKGLVRAILQQEMGRDPTSAEMEDFSSALTSAMRANPTTSKTTGTYEKGQLVDQNTVTHNGIGVQGLQEVAEQRAEAMPGHAEWQAIGTYLPALYGALGSAVPGT